MHGENFIKLKEKSGRFQNSNSAIKFRILNEMFVTETRITCRFFLKRTSPRSL
jgi:hypothetical protein